MDINVIVRALLNLVSPGMPEFWIGLIIVIVTYLISCLQKKKEVKSALTTGLIIGAGETHQETLDKANLEKDKSVRDMVQKAISNPLVPEADSKVEKFIKKNGGLSTLIPLGLTILKKVSPLFKK